MDAATEAHGPIVEAVLHTVAKTTMTVEVPPAYGYVILTAGVGAFVMNIMLGGPVMQARKKYGIKYPNLYAVPGYHKDADAFNRVQRGHQHIYEEMCNVTAMLLVGGLKHPYLCTAGALLWQLGSALYLAGYKDTSRDVKTARYQKGGGIKWLGITIGIGASISFAGTLLKWW